MSRMVAPAMAPAVEVVCAGCGARAPAQGKLDLPGGFAEVGESAEAWGLTMGQLLSLPMVAAGILVLLVARRRG